MRKLLLLVLASALGAGAAALAGAAVHLPPRDALHLAWLAAAGGLVAGCAGGVGMLALRSRSLAAPSGTVPAGGTISKGGWSPTALQRTSAPKKLGVRPGR